MNEVICYGQTNAGSWCQEVYCTLSKQAGIRARQLRKAGYQVTSFGMGPQVTPVGTVKLTMLTILPGARADTFGLPAVRLERL